MENNDFTSRLQKEIKEKQIMDSILQKVRNNPEIIDTLSDERLEQLITLQNKKLRELDIEIEEMKRKIGKKTE